MVEVEQTVKGHTAGGRRRARGETNDEVMAVERERTSLEWMECQDAFVAPITARASVGCRIVSTLVSCWTAVLTFNSSTSRLKRKDYFGEMRGSYTYSTG